MSAMEKSDLPEVARKRANKAVSAAAEPVERRGGTKESADLQSTVRTQSRLAVSQAQARIREAVTRNRQGKLTALLHHINVDVLRASFFGLKKSAAPGIDEMTWTEYAETLEANLVDLHARVHTGAYRALPSRRRYIPKADGRQRPLGDLSLPAPHDRTLARRSHAPQPAASVDVATNEDGRRSLPAIPTHPASVA